MKIVHTADWHIGKTVNEFSMLDDQIYFLNKLKQKLCAVKADVLIIAGDLYDRSVPSAEAVSAVNRFFTELTAENGIKVICIAGNHDSGERLEFASRLCEKGGLYICGKLYKTGVRKITLTDEYGAVNFYLVPYSDPASARAALECGDIHTFNDIYEYLLEHIKSDFDSNERNLLVTHGNFSFIDDKAGLSEVFSQGEASVGGADLVNAAGFDIFDYSALGHIHAPKKIWRENIRYSGSLLKYSVDEAAQKKEIPVIDLFEKGDVSVSSFTITPMRDIEIIRGGFDEIMSALHAPSDNYVFAELSDSQPVTDAVMRLRAKYPNIMGLKYSFKINSTAAMTTPQTVESKTPELLFYDFYKQITGDEIDDFQKDIVAQAYRNIIEEYQR